jgi:DNA ligase-associated metallophosphoesterase
MRDLEVEVHDETLVLLPERAVYWPRTATLLVADAHWGKAAAFRAAGVVVPRGTTTEGLARLDAMLSRTGARRIIFLGDLLHAREGRSPETLRVLGEWCVRRSTIEMTLVRGNHDRRAGDPPMELGIECVDAPLIEAPFVLAHRPAPHPAGYVLAGHLHPAVLLAGEAGLRARLSCFWLGQAVGVLPAFGDFTGTAAIAMHEGDRVFVIAEGGVVEVGTTRACRAHDQR